MWGRIWGSPPPSHPTSLFRPIESSKDGAGAKPATKRLLSSPDV